MSREREGRDVALSCASPLTQIPWAGGIKDQEVTSDPPLEEVSSLASRGFSRSGRMARTGRLLEGTGTCCRGSPHHGFGHFLEERWGSQRCIASISPSVPLLQEIRHFLTCAFWCQGSSAAMANLNTHLQSPSQPYLAPFSGDLRAQANWWPCPRRHRGEGVSCDSHFTELMCAARSTSAVKTKQLFHLVPIKHDLRHPLACSK